MPKKGYKQTQEHKDKISKTMKGKMPKFIPNNKGKIRTLEQRKMYSEILKQNFKDGIRKPWNKGKKGYQNFSKGKKRAKMTGENHFHWKGGLPTCKDCGKKLSRYDAKYCAKCILKHKTGCRNNLTKNKKYLYFLNSRRQIKKIKNGGSHTFGEWETLKAQYNWTCPACKRKEPEIQLTEDHIIPLDKGGSDNIENIQPLCGSCNSKKHTKIIKYKNNE